MADSMDRKKFGAFIARKRNEQGLTQAALADAVGIVRPYLAQIESGTRLPADDKVERLLVMLGSPMTEFINEVVGPKLTDEQRNAALALMAPAEMLAQNMSPEAFLQLASQMQSLEQMAVNMNKLAPEPQPIGPEGWLELSKEDRRLVQRIVNRLLKTAEKEADDGDPDAD
ncbi:MAG: helix-turn-helix domain-containing protein [Coriobacteriia bacterium]